MKPDARFPLGGRAITAGALPCMLLAIVLRCAWDWLVRILREGSA